MSKAKKKSQNNSDIIVVLFILAVMILGAAVATMCPNSEVDIGSKDSATKQQQEENDNRDEIVMVGVVSVAVIIVVCFVVKKVKEAKRREEAMRLYNERLAEQKRVEEAKERIKQARRQEMIEAGIKQLTEGHSGRNYGARGQNASRGLYDDEFDTSDINDKRLEKYYRNRRSDELLDDDRFFDDLYDDEQEDEYEPETLLEKIRYTLSNISGMWWIAIIALVVVGGIIIVTLVL